MTLKDPVKQLWMLSALSCALVVIALIWALLDARTLLGTGVWMKPLKFALSFAVFFPTLALAAGRLSAAYQTGRAMRLVTALLVASFMFEMFYITFQAAQGQASHFNTADPFHGVMYAVMGLGAFLLVVGTAIVGVLVLQDKAVRMPVAVRLGVGIGFTVSTILTLITAFTLSSMAGHFVGTPVDGAALIPFFGWSATVGDLRPSHFFALHMMQALPMLAFLINGWRLEKAWIFGGAGIYAALTLALYAQALMGLPLIRL